MANYPRPKLTAESQTKHAVSSYLGARSSGRCTLFIQFALVVEPPTYTRFWYMMDQIAGNMMSWLKGEARRLLALSS